MQVPAGQQEQYRHEGRIPQVYRDRDPHHIQAPHFDHTHSGSEAALSSDAAFRRSTPLQDREKMSIPKLPTLEKSAPRFRTENGFSNENGQELDPTTGWSIVQDMVAHLQSDQMRIQQSVS